jgi:hypothetical protein
MRTPRTDETMVSSSQSSSPKETPPLIIESSWVRSRDLRRPTWNQSHQVYSQRDRSAIPVGYPAAADLEPRARAVRPHLEPVNTVGVAS